MGAGPQRAGGPGMQTTTHNQTERRLSGAERHLAEWIALACVTHADLAPRQAERVAETAVLCFRADGGSVAPAAPRADGLAGLALGLRRLCEEADREGR